MAPHRHNIICVKLTVFCFKLQSVQKETQTLKWNFLGLKIIEFQNDSISVALFFNNELYNRVSSLIGLQISFLVVKIQNHDFLPPNFLQRPFSQNFFLNVFFLN